MKRAAAAAAAMRVRLVMRFSSEETARAFRATPAGRASSRTLVPGRRTSHAPTLAVAPFVAPAPGLRAARVQAQRLVPADAPRPQRAVRQLLRAGRVDQVDEVRPAQRGIQVV